MRIEQFVVAHGVEQERIRAILPKGYEINVRYCK